MRIDAYTKVILTAIAFFLAVIAIKPIFAPDAIAHAQGGFSGVEFGAGPSFFDTRTGDLWFYADTQVYSHYRVQQLGKSLIKMPSQSGLTTDK